MESLLLVNILLSPLAGALLSWRMGGSLGKGFAKCSATLAVFISFVLAIYLAAPFYLDPKFSIHLPLFDWLALGGLKISFGLLWDSLSALMTLIITGVGSLIHLYSVSYMAKDASCTRFFTYLNLFVFFMLLLVLGDNLLLVFVGWEGVGLCSYLLIGFWFKKLNYTAAGRKAFIFNRIGDAGFLIAIFALVTVVGSTQFLDLAEWTFSGDLLVLVAAVGLFFASTGKSAQIPLCVWLPDAMAGPTPVSALIHAATMVTAGIYLLARMHYLFTPFPMLQEVIFYIALATAAFAALIALFQNDLKKILAYSTVSQLGFMFMAAATGAYWVALFHVTTHAFFKAGLFLSAGNIIHYCGGNQDVRKMGGLYKRIPLTFIVYLICTLAISGIYPLAGYFSKHDILSAIHLTSFTENYYYIVQGLSFLTLIYMTRSLTLVFFGKQQGDYSQAHAPSLLMNFSILVLAILSVVAGLLLGGVLPDFLKPAIGGFALGTHEELKLLAILFPLVMFVLVALLYSKFSWTSVFLDKLSYLPRNKFFLDELYDVLITRPLSFLAKLSRAVLESSIVDTGLTSPAVMSQMTAYCLSKFHTGQLKVYTSAFLFAALFIIIFVFLV